LCVRFCTKSTLELTRTLKDSYYLNFQCEKIKVNCNNRPALRIAGLSHEIDFTFKKEVNNLPVKKSKLELENEINMQSLQVHMSPSLFKALHEVINFYQWGLWLSSSKHKIVGLLQDRQFLMTNIISNNGRDSAQSHRITFTDE